MVENIPQVNYMDTSQWPKDMHLGYAKNVVRRIDEEWTEVYPAPAKLLAEITPLKTAVTKEDEDYEQSRKADQTEAIRQTDEERDGLLNQALTVIDAMAKVSAIPASQQAALQLKGQVDIYKPSAKLALREESTQVEQWLQAISQSAVLEAAVATLGLTQILADLKTKNDQVIELMDARAADRAQRALIQLSEDRKETDRCMRNFFRMLDAVACMDADEERYLNVLDHEGVPHHNNASEAAIRILKVKTKVSGGFRTQDGADEFAVFHSIADTAKRNKKSKFKILYQLIVEENPDATFYRKVYCLGEKPLLPPKQTCRGD